MVFLLKSLMSVAMKCASAETTSERSWARVSVGAAHMFKCWFRPLGLRAVAVILRGSGGLSKYTYNPGIPANKRTYPHLQPTY